MTDIRIGNGFDIHRLAEGRKCILGGVEIPFSRGLLGHSDADVLLHAVSDAILGALVLGDIGCWFPDTDSVYKDADSKELLRQILVHPTVKEWRLVNLDCIIFAEQPKIAPHMMTIRQSLATLLQVDIERISVKAKTMEKLGEIGRGEAIATQVVVLMKKENQNVGLA